MKTIDEPTKFENSTPATYRKCVNPVHDGNPFIEALESHTQEDVARKLEWLPPYDPKDQKRPLPEKLELLDNLPLFFQPLPRHLSLTQSIESLMRTGYAGRCPRWGRPDPNIPQNNLVSGALFGLSGLGKTATVTRILRLHPQWIRHTKYRGKEVECDQIAWLKVETPHNGSERSVCTSIFKQLDMLLGTNYSDIHGGSRSTTSHMIPALNDLVRQYNLGLLVIDEIQNLSMKAGEKGSNEMVAFMVRMINDLNVPVLMIGTSNSVKPGQEFDSLDSSFRVRRRATGLADPVWAPLRHEKDEWRIFSKSLWRFQYLPEKVKLNKRLDLEFFTLTQGVPDLAVKLFHNAQIHALRGKKELTPEFLSQVSQRMLRANEKDLNSLRLAKSQQELFAKQQNMDLGLPEGDKPDLELLGDEESTANSA